MQGRAGEAERTIVGRRGRRGERGEGLRTACLIQKQQTDSKTTEQQIGLILCVGVKYGAEPKYESPVYLTFKFLKSHFLTQLKKWQTMEHTMAMGFWRGETLSAHAVLLPQT